MARNFGGLIGKSALQGSEKRSRIQWFYEYLSTLPEEAIAPDVSAKIFRYFRDQQLDRNPYAAEKLKYNQLLLDRYDVLRSQIVAHNDPFDRALRYVLAGNIIDFGAHQSVELEETLTRVVEARFDRDHSSALRKDLSEAKRILWLGDNAGEIVMDKLFIDALGLKNVVYAVRGAPVINDATLEDAAFVDLAKVAHVIANGNDAPSTLLHACSEEFCSVFYDADIIISKGQGNFEGLMNHKEKRIYFLLMAKCQVIAEKLAVSKGSFVVFCNQSENAKDSYS
ncbi:MAG: ARMT1-like domain-containing protein [Bacteroidales bacterium]